MKKGSLLGFLLMSMYILFAQNEQKDSLLYNKQDFFLQSFNPSTVNAYRSASGTPGPMYWQNRASYLIHATLSEKDTSITGDVVISYTNNSPDKLDYMWLQLDQNLFDSASRGAAATPVSGDRFDVRKFNRGGYHIGLVTITYAGKSYNVQPLISDTRMQIRLKNPVLPKGDKISVRINYNFAIPGHGADRLGRMHSKNGKIYAIAQWYPRMCVYDDIEGWNTLPYLGEVNSISIMEIMIIHYCPCQELIVGSGELQNPQDVLTATQIKRLAQAKQSDKTVIISLHEVTKPSSGHRKKNLHGILN